MSPLSIPFWEIASDSFLTAMDAGFCIQIVLFATPAPLPRLRYNEAVYHDLYQLGSWKESPGRQGNHFTVITRKVSPPEPFGSGGRSFFLQMVFEKRRTDGHFQTHRRHFSDDFYQESPCSQGLSWYRYCTNWGIGRPGRLEVQHRVRPFDCTNWGIECSRRLVGEPYIEAQRLYQLGGSGDREYRV